MYADYWKLYLNATISEYHFEQCMRLVGRNIFVTPHTDFNSFFSSFAFNPVDATQLKSMSVNRRQSDFLVAIK